MNILLIGNGFDLAHGLPTRYDDFLNFIDLLIQASDYSVKHSFLDLSNNHEIVPELKDFLRSESIEHNDSRAKEMLDCVKANVWIEYFLKVYKATMNRGWVGFEREISEVTQGVDNSGSSDSVTNRKGANSKAKAMPTILKQYNLFCTETLMFEQPKATERLLEDLERLIRCLEIYLCLCLELIHPINRIQTVDDIIDIVKYKGSINAVLSFNYTDTFERIYESNLFKRPEYCYIHGRARAENNITIDNMVLGIDEYLDEQKRNTKIEYVHFKKYYQRILKQTDYNYTEWLRRRESKNLFIIGHSLDVTDKDVLREILTADGVKTTIYYHNKNANARQIENLIKLLGYDKLNELTRGRGGSSSITFATQLE